MQISEIALDASDAASRQIRSDDIWAWWEKLTETERLSVLRGLNVAQRRELVRRWYGFQNDGQREPLGEWRIWLIQAGRGFGKTRAGAEWVSQVARDVPGARIALVAATVADGQRVMIEGPSGLIAVARAHEPVRWVRERRELRFASGAVATLYSSEAGADRVVAESNMGGEMVASTLHAAEVTLPVVPVHASVGKARRAEPVALAYERGQVVHAGVFAELEDQLCGFQTGGGYAGPGRSPDRADACVWALAALLEGLRRGRAPGVRRV